MKPDERLITIHSNVSLINELLSDLVLTPRINVIKWSRVTRQTANIKIGYPGQHLASLVTGMEGERTGARGNDLVDGSEVKSCSRIDQLDACLECRAPVSRLENTCPQCDSERIRRNNDSKWLFTIRSEADLNLILDDVRRIVLLLGDYPNFDEHDYTTLRFQCFEIWPQSHRHTRFREIMSNYYTKIYLAHRRANPNATPAPKNFWPYQYQFYLCNPIPTFRALVYSADTSPVISIEHYVEPDQDRTTLPSVMMPATITNQSEWQTLVGLASDAALLGSLDPLSKAGLSAQRIRLMPYREAISRFPSVDEELRNLLPLRDTDRIATSAKVYSRRRRVSPEEA